MQTGLHMGLASWINDMRKSDHFLNCPATPKQIKLVDLETVHTMQEQGNVLDFSTMTNFIPKRGMPIDSSTNLWRAHRDIIRQMDFANEPWNDIDRTEYSQAISILYDEDSTGMPMLSQDHIFYNEMKSTYEAVVSSGADTATINQAMTDWTHVGKKALIENAFSTISRLMAISSIEKASTESMSLEEPAGIALNYYGSTHFAPVHFSPISAISEDTWMEAELSFQELDKYVSKTIYKGNWNGFKANRDGRVLFDYVILECNRTWFTQSLYENDDWNLGDSQIVSTGDGKEGLLPAYVNTVYLVKIKNISYKPVSKPSIKPQKLGHIHSYNKLGALLLTKIKANKNLGAVRSRSNVTLPKSVGSRALGVAGNKQRPARANILSTAIKPNKLNVLLTAQPIAKYSVIRNSELLRKITVEDLASRLNVANRLLGNNSGKREAVSPNENSQGTYIVGFGCKKTPLSPNPNPSYSW